MTKLLVSVRSVDEARRAIQAGADLVDIKEPSRGSLGHASIAVIRAISQEFNGQIPLSAACGELLQEKIEFESLPPRLSFAKLGLQGCARVPSWRERLRAAWRRVPSSIRRVGVAYADWQTCEAPLPEAVIRESVDGGCSHLLIDTVDKRRAGLFSVVSPAVVARWMALAQAGGLGTVIAGSISASTLPIARRLQPDYVAVRGAACSGSRTSTICSDRIRQLRELLIDPC